MLVINPVKVLSFAAGAIGCVALLWILYDNGRLRDEVAALQKANAELADGALQAKRAIKAVTDQTTACQVALEDARRGCEERMQLWITSTTTPADEVRDEVLDRKSTSHYFDSMSGSLDRLR